jgi:hypothetical protein
MAASVAALAGADPRARGVRERVLRCLIGEAPRPVPMMDHAARTAEEETLDRVGLKLAERGLNLLVTAGVSAAQWAGRQVAKGLVVRRLSRGIPLLGGVLGAISDGYVTSAVAEAAIAEFMPGRDDGNGGPPAHAGDGLPTTMTDLPRVAPSAP